MRKAVAEWQTQKIALINVSAKLQQVQNDLDAAKRREEIMRKELDLARQNSLSVSQALQHVMEERDDWKSAFKTISRLVK